MIAARRSALAAFVSASLTAGALSAAETPRVTGRSGPPPEVALKADAAGFGYVVKIRPGSPAPGAVLDVAINVNQLLEKPDPTYGKRKPVEDAQLTAILIGPPPAKGKKGSAHSEARRCIKVSDSGSYAVSFLLPADIEPGVYGLYLRGRSDEAGPLEWGDRIGVGVWPVPPEAALPALPAKIPEAAAGNLAQGRRLCDSHCKKNIEGALPAGKTPEFLSSAVGAGLTDAALLALAVGDKAESLSELERSDLLFFLRGLSLHIRDFFPEAAVFTKKSFTIDANGLERLADRAKLKISGKDAEGVVYVVYKSAKGETPAEPQYVPYDNRVARDKLSTKDRVGFLIVFDTDDKRVRELGVALGREPKYSIVGLIGRGADGKVVAKKELESYVGQGEVDNPDSLKKGNAAWAKLVGPIYLRAAELATMYFAEEREFTAFDDEFGAK